MLKKQFKSMFYVMKLLMTNVECLIQGNPQGLLSRISSVKSTEDPLDVTDVIILEEN